MAAKMKVAGNDRSDVSGAAENEAGPGDADEAGDVDGPGDTEARASV